jgi:peptidoglycan/LPS O-acetylase OafA/YrhL
MNPAIRSKPLDLLRSWAIAWVFLFHYLNASEAKWLYGVARFGWAGVDLFFVLSGFLIGSQLLKPLASGNLPSIGKFYLRRFFRTLPNYWVVLALYFVVPAFAERSGLPPLWKFLTFTQNLGLDHHAQGAYSHAWSLCVEEWFYLCLPIFLLFLRRVKSPARVATFLFSMLVFGLACRGLIWLNWIGPALTNGQHKPIYSYFNQLIYYPTYTRLDGLLVGVTIAAIYRLQPNLWHKLNKVGNYLPPLGLVLLALGFFLSTDRFSFTHTVLTYPIIASGFGCFVTAAVLPASFLSKIRVPGTTWIATLAFSFYLTHKQVIQWVLNKASDQKIDPERYLPLLISVVASIGVSLLLYFLVERPFLKLRDRVLETIPATDEQTLPAAQTLPIQFP